MVARLLWEQDAAGSSPVTPTISSVHNGFKLWALDFFAISSFFVMYRAGFKACSFVLCRFGNIPDGYAFSCICLVIASAFGRLNISGKFVTDHYSLATVFTDALGSISHYLIYEFPKTWSSQLLHFHKSSDSADKSVFTLLHCTEIVYSLV